MKPKVLVIVLLALVALFVFSTIRATGRRGPSGGPVVSILTSQPMLVGRIGERLDQPVLPGEIVLADRDRAAGCAWDGQWMRVPPGAACHFTIRVEKRARWQFNSAKRLRLRLAGLGGSVNVTLERAGEVPAGEKTQAVTLQQPTNLPPTDLPTPGARTPAPPTPTPRPTPTPVQFVVYDQENQGQDWLLTLDGCQAPEAGICLVELVE